MSVSNKDFDELAARYASAQVDLTQLRADRDALEADRDNWKFTYYALERKYNELMVEWNTIEGLK